MTFIIRREETEALRYVDFGFAATNIKRLLRLVKLSAAKAFNEMFGETSGFLYTMDGGNSDIDLDDSLVETQSRIMNKTSVSFNYKITCDNGDGKYVSLYYRNPRREFIELMIKYLDQYKQKINFNITRLEYKDTGGSNPRMTVQFRQSDKFSDPRTGKIKPKNTNINFSFALKYAGDASQSGTKQLETLKPNHVTPSIVGKWLSPKQLYDNVIAYINGSNFPVSSVMIKQKYTEAVTNSFRSKSLIDDLGIGSELSSEFFEILTCLKLANLLQDDDKSIKELCGYPDEPITEVKINIPSAANESLLDYKIAVNGNLESPLKISVKSKVKGTSTAPVKFTDAFANEQEVHEWFKNLKFSRAKNYNLGQRMIASSSLEYSKYGGKKTLYPIRGLRKILSGPKSSTISADFRDRMDTKHMNISEWKNLITIIDKKMSSLSSTFVPLDDIIDDEKLLLKSKKMIAENLYKFSKQKEKNTKMMKNLVGSDVDPSDVKFWKKESPSGKYPFSINNVALLCERVLVRSSQRTSSSKLNFYKLFYDQVLVKEAIMYAVTSRKEVNGTEKLVYTFRNAKNYKKYEKWITLRTKNYPNNMQDSLGMQT